MLRTIEYLASCTVLAKGAEPRHIQLCRFASAFQATSAYCSGVLAATRATSPLTSHRRRRRVFADVLWRSVMFLAGGILHYLQRRASHVGRALLAFKAAGHVNDPSVQVA